MPGLGGRGVPARVTACGRGGRTWPGPRRWSPRWCWVST